MAIWLQLNTGIDHAFLLQFIVKNVNDRLHQVSIIHKRDNGNWNKFMKVLNDASKGNCRNLVAWNGCNGSGGLSSNWSFMNTKRSSYGL